MGNEVTKTGSVSLPPFVRYSCRLELVGNAGVGKSTFLESFKDPERDFTPSFGVTHCKREIRGEEKLIKFGDNWGGYADGVVAIYSLDSLKSFQDVVQTVLHITFKNGGDAPIMMVGNKEDISSEERQIPRNREKLLDSLPPAHKTLLMQKRFLDWFEISALSGEGVDSVITTIADIIFLEQTRMVYIKPAGENKKNKKKLRREGREKKMTRRWRSRLGKRKKGGA
mmetsp:Transcript_17910/g.28015  ORF Transcript_17910/g.28015 Transcript_17910/m.28015 type:complete len:226 (-) Transcript_17910:23-700(-)